MPSLAAAPSLPRLLLASVLGLTATVGTSAGVMAAALDEPPVSAPFSPGHDAPPPPAASAAEIRDAIAREGSTTAASTSQQANDSGLMLNAVSYQSTSFARPIQIQLYEDSDDSLAIAAQLKEALLAAGYQVTDGKAPLSLSFEMSGQADGVTPGGSSVLEVDGTDKANQRYRAHLNVFSSTQSSLVTGEGKSAEQSATVANGGPSVRYQISINDTTNGKRLWDGWANGPIAQQGAVASARLMTPALVKAIGQTIRNQPIPLPVAK